MRLRNRQDSGIPEVNLVPMMDVLMSVLTFFVISTLTMTGQNITGVELPKGVEGKGVQELPNETEKLIIGLTEKQAISINDQEIAQEEMITQMQTFLQENPDGIVVLSAHRSLEYQQIEALLKIMGAVGGERVSLAIQKTQ
ncbi:MAG: biopolymer transporter ExbD [Cyanobacteria bacterium P01_G01_bin.54]